MTRTRWTGGLEKALLVAILAILVRPDAAAASLGALGDDLVYVPLAPCRVLDTRLAGGAFAPNEQRHYDLIGQPNFAVYGGANGDCGLGGAGAIFSISTLAYNIPRALLLNFVAVGPQGPGHFTAWPTGGAVPLASILNYGSVGGLNIANGLVVTTCAATCVDTTPPFSCSPALVCPSGDLSLQAAVSGSHLVVDVMGYFRGADTTSVRALHSEGVGADDITIDGTCQTVTQCSITAPAGESGRVLVTASASVDFQNFGAISQQAGLTISSVGECDNVEQPGTVRLFMDPGSSFGIYPAGLTRSFALGAGQTGTYTLNARGYQGFAAADDRVYGGIIECVFLP